MRGRWGALALMVWLCAAGAHAEGDWLENEARLDCERLTCDARCTCQCSPDNDTSVLANCRGAGLTTVPSMADFPEQLMVLDLRDNGMSHIDAVWLVTLRDMRLRLAGNPLACDCASRPLLAALRTYRDLVEDYNNVTCAGDGGAVRDVDLSSLCAVGGVSRDVWVALTVVMAVILVLLVMVFLYRRYQQNIQMFLFGRGWCLSCVRERDSDHEAALPHDVFITFGQQDEPFVVEHLLPRLEQEYNVCWYQNGSMPGLPEPFNAARLAQLVQSSRRMVIVVSRNFVSSSRNMVEFRTAYTSALSEGRVRIIVVILDEIAVENYPDADLRFVLRTNTCLHWTDPQFWQKLRYALPHYPHRRTSDSTPLANGSRLP